MLQAWTSAELLELEKLRRSKLLRLTTHQGMQGFVHRNGDPDALVADLLRLAVFATEIRQLAELDPTTPAADLVRYAETKAGALFSVAEAG